MILNIVKLPDSRLRVPSTRIPDGPVSQELLDLAEAMFETLRAANGVGLSANQIGHTERLAVVEVPVGDRMFRRTLFNLEVTIVGPRRPRHEGCLSIPDRVVWPLRAHTVAFKYMSDEGVYYGNHVSGYPAQALQHECDHLDGYLITAPRRGGNHVGTQ